MKYLLSSLLLVCMLFISASSQAFTAEMIGTDLVVIYDALSIKDIKWLTISVNRVPMVRMEVSGMVLGTQLSAQVPLPARLTMPYTVSIRFEDKAGADLYNESVIVAK